MDVFVGYDFNFLIDFCDELEKLKQQPCFDDCHLAPNARVPLPQADNVSRIIDIIKLAAAWGGDIHKNEIEHSQRFVGRQVGYYASAAAYLNLLDSVGYGHYVLTEEGRRITLSTQSAQLESVATRLLRDKIVRAVAFAALEGATEQRIRQIAEHEIQMFCSEREIVISESTLRRRVTTYKSWARWALSTLDYICNGK